jgi:hypothetical protein
VSFGGVEEECVMKLKKESIISSKLKRRVEIKSKMYQRRAHRSAGEEKCRQVLSRIYPHYKFETYRPNFLKNPETGRNLELDLYNDRLKLAVEFNGRQHYQHTPFFQTKDEFKEQKRRDELKKKLCKKNGITLIFVPYDVNIETYLVAKLVKKGKYHRKKKRDDTCIIL